MGGRENPGLMGIRILCCRVGVLVLSAFLPCRRMREGYFGGSLLTVLGICRIPQTTGLKTTT